MNLKKKKYWPRRNKFGAIRTECKQGHSHPSKGEAEHCDKLHMVFRSGTYRWKRIEYERKYLLQVKGQLVCSHRPDWTITREDDSLSVVEFKGAETRDWKLRMKLFKALFPEIEYTVVKRR